ncbi:MAG: nucleoside deaminase [Oligoflexia bacterium]|nr:nucleoside deaminase [Oligoflexia bacterium]
MPDIDVKFMKLALKEAEKAFKKREVPVGALIVKDNRIIARGHNERISRSDSTAHAEINAIRKASKKLGDWRLCGTTLYVTVEPCLMCAGAVIHSRIGRVVFGCAEPKMGALVSQYRVFDNSLIHHIPEYTGYVLAEECGRILGSFFAGLR